MADPTTGRARGEGGLRPIGVVVDEAIVSAAYRELIAIWRHRPYDTESLLRAARGLSIAADVLLEHIQARAKEEQCR